MLGIKTKLPIDLADARSAFEKLDILRRAFGEIDFRHKPTILPSHDLDSIHFDGTARAFNRLANFVRKTMEVDDQIKTLFLNQEGARAKAADLRALREGHWKERGAAGVYYHRGEAEGGGEPPVIAIDLERFAGASPASLVSVIAHEHAHHALSSRTGIDTDDEELADFLPVLAGFGIFFANSAFSYETDGKQVGSMAWHSWRVATLGYVREDVLAFAQGLVTLWKGEQPRLIRSDLKPSTESYFCRRLRFLQSNRLTCWDMVSSKEASEELEAWLARTVESVNPTNAPRAPEIRRVEVKWSGTFVGSTTRVEDDVVAWYRPEAIDFGQQTKRMQWKSDTCFGIAYRISSEIPGCPFEIDQLLFRVASSSPKVLRLRRWSRPAKSPPESLHISFPLPTTLSSTSLANGPSSSGMPKHHCFAKPLNCTLDCGSLCSVLPPGAFAGVLATSAPAHAIDNVASHVSMDAGEEPKGRERKEEPRLNESYFREESYAHQPQLSCFHIRLAHQTFSRWPGMGVEKS